MKVTKRNLAEFNIWFRRGEEILKEFPDRCP